VVRFSTMARIRQFSDEEHAMRVTCYLVSALVIAVSIGVVVYTLFLRQLSPAFRPSAWKACNKIPNCSNRPSSSLVISDRVGSEMRKVEVRRKTKRPNSHRVLGR
jgi:hypothetical protein